MAKNFRVNTLLLSGSEVTAIGNTLYVNGQPISGGTGPASSGSAGITGASVTGSSYFTGTLNFATGSGISLILDEATNTVTIGVSPTSLTTLSGIGGTQVISSGSYLLISGGGGTGSQPIDTGSFVTTGQTGAFFPRDETGAFYSSTNPAGYLTGPLNTGSFVVTGQTGAFASVVNLNTTGTIVESKLAVISGTTGSFITNSQTGGFFPRVETGAFYSSTNPAGYITSAQAGGVSSIRVTGIDASGVVTFTGIGGVTISIEGSTIRVSGGATTDTGSFVTTGQTGQFASVINLAATGAFLQSEIVIISGTTGSFITTTQTGDFASAVNLTATGATLSGQIIALSGYAVSVSGTTVNLSGQIVAVQSYATSVSGSTSALSGQTQGLQGQINTINNKTGTFVTTAQTGEFASTGWVDQYYYPRTNPSGYGGTGPGGGGVSTITVDGAAISGDVFVTGYGNNTVFLSGQYIIVSGAPSTGGSPPIETGGFVDLGSPQTILGEKIFATDLRISGVGADLDIWTSGADHAIIASGYYTGFFEINVQNLTIGTDASADLVAASSTNPDANYVDLGVNSDVYTGKMVGYTGDGYCYHVGGDFYVGNITTGRRTYIFAGHPMSGTNQRDFCELVVTDTGIGIRTGNPAYALDVAGAGNFQQGLRVSGRNVLMAPFEFSKGVTWTNNEGITSGSYDSAVWMANKPATLTGIRAWRSLGSGTIINAYKNNKSTPHLAANLSITGISGWVSSGVIGNSGYVDGDTLILSIISVTGLPVSITIQAEFLS